MRYDVVAGWSSLVARWAHNPKVGGSNPPPATNFFNRLRATEKIKPRPTHIKPHISFAMQRILSLLRVVSEMCVDVSLQIIWRKTLHAIWRISSMDELAGLTGEARKRALDRFHLLQPHLEK